MSKFKFVGKLVRRTAFGAGIGALAASLVSPGHARTKETKQGLLIGATAGFAAVGIPKILRTKTAREVIKASGKIIFRRFRGRIIPIRKK